jgi:tripartite-type tricarboxylate transporter receptor subunit TctC
VIHWYRHLIAATLAAAGLVSVPDLTARIHAEIVRAVAAPKVRERLAGLGFEEAQASSPTQLERAVRMDYERNAAIVKAFNITLD